MDIISKAGYILWAIVAAAIVVCCCGFYICCRHNSDAEQLEDQEMEGRESERTDSGGMSALWIGLCQAWFLT